MQRLVTAILVAVASTAVAAAQPSAAPPGSAELTAQLERLNRTLERIADSLTRQSKLDLVVRRIELGASRVAALEKSLAAVEAERRSLTDESERFVGRKAALRQQVDEGVLEATPAQLDTATAQLNAEIARIANRLLELTGEIAELQNRLAEQRADHQEWQMDLDELIEAL